MIWGCMRALSGIGLSKRRNVRLRWWCGNFLLKAWEPTKYGLHRQPVEVDKFRAFGLTRVDTTTQPQHNLKTLKGGSVTNQMERLEHKPNPERPQIRPSSFRSPSRGYTI